MDRSRFSCERPKKHPPNRPVASKCSSHTISASFPSSSLAEREGQIAPSVAAESAVLGGFDHPICSQTLRCFQFERPV